LSPEVVGPSIIRIGSVYTCGKSHEPSSDEY
jgi:hypothetical protein